MEVEVHDLEKIMVKVSKEYFVELSQDEALQYVSKKEKLMNNQIERLHLKMAETKAHMVFVTEAVRELLHISEEKQKQQRQFL